MVTATKDVMMPGDRDYIDHGVTEAEQYANPGDTRPTIDELLQEAHRLSLEGEQIYVMDDAGQKGLGGVAMSGAFSESLQIGRPIPRKLQTTTGRMATAHLRSRNV